LGSSAKHGRPELPIKFLADVNVEKPIVDFLAEKGYDIKWIQDYDCAMSDEALLQTANDEKRLLLTNDKDFGELVFLQKKLSSGVVLIRVKGQDTALKVSLVKKLLECRSDRLRNHFTVITRKKIRMFPMEDIA
jgi:predicted nuclease of predicted toxin-antitoxin system